MAVGPACALANNKDNPAFGESAALQTNADDQWRPINTDRNEFMLFKVAMLDSSTFSSDCPLVRAPFCSRIHWGMDSWCSLRVQCVNGCRRGRDSANQNRNLAKGERIERSTSSVVIPPGRPFRTVKHKAEVQSFEKLALSVRSKADYAWPPRCSKPC